jgi:hypothetical protein
LSDVIDFTPKLKEKHLDKMMAEAAETPAAEWTPIQALDQAREWAAARGADKCIVIWTEDPSLDDDTRVVLSDGVETPPGMVGPVQSQSVYYMISNMDRSDALALIVHLGKKLINEWF